MALDEVLDDGEAKPGATGRAAAAGIRAVEALGDAGQVLGRDAIALVANRDEHPAGAGRFHRNRDRPAGRSEEHTSELQSLMRISYAVFCLKKKNDKQKYENQKTTQ